MKILGTCSLCGNDVRPGATLRCPHGPKENKCSTPSSRESPTPSGTESPTPSLSAPPTEPADPGGVAYVSRGVATKAQRDAFYRKLNELENP